MCGVTTRTTCKTERGRAKNARVENRILKIFNQLNIAEKTIYIQYLYSNTD